MSFVHLNVHSCYSLLAGSMKPEEIPARARRLGFTSIALTDSDGLYAALPFQRACDREGVHAILGAEITRPRLRRSGESLPAPGPPRGLFTEPDEFNGDESVGDFAGQGVESSRETGGFSREKPAGPGDPRHRATLLARNDAGYRLIAEILTARHCDDAFDLKQALAAALASGDVHILCAGEGLLRSLVASAPTVAADPSAAAGSPTASSATAVSSPAASDGGGPSGSRSSGPSSSPSNSLTSATGRLFVELRPGDGPSRLLRLQAQLAAAEKFGLPCLATAGVFFARPSDHELHRYLSAMRLGCSASNMPSGACAPSGAWLMDEASMRRAMGIPRDLDTRAARESSGHDEKATESASGDEDLLARIAGGGQSAVAATLAAPPSTVIDPRLSAALDETAKIAADCHARIPAGRPRPPRFALPAGPDGRGQPTDAFLYRLAHEGLRERMGLAPGDRDRRARRALASLRRELHVIRRRGVSAYFLIAWDLVRYGRGRGLASLGRGSAAGSLVSFALSITHVDPLENGLYFERFLSLERGGLPDFDIDFGSQARYEIQDYAFRRYGRERVAMIGTYQCFRPRGAFRALIGALGLDDDEWSDFIKLLPRWGSIGDLPRKLKEDPRTRHLDLTREPLPRLFELAARLDGLPRHLGTHPCGIVIAPEPIAGIVPLQRGAQGLAITQWDMHAVEDAGLIKMDILGQRGLAVIDACFARVKMNFGRAPRLAGDPPPLAAPRRAKRGGELGEGAGVVNPFLDTKTRELLAAGASQGCFYIESPIMMQIMRQSRCRDFETLTALSSIIRPGVSNHGGKRSYLMRHLGKEAIAVPHPLLEPILRDTKGCLIYQEQVMRVLQVIGGLSLGEADAFRKVMSGKGGDQGDCEARFIAGALTLLKDDGTAKDETRELAAEIWRQVASFAGYAFCKAHSASFARESFESAWWKAHYPAEFMASVIEERGGYYGTGEYVEEARRLGLEILPPHVNAGTVETQGWSRGSVDQDPCGDAGSLGNLFDSGSNDGARPDGDGGDSCRAAGDSKHGDDFGGAADRPPGLGSREAGRLRIGLSFLRGVRSVALRWMAKESERHAFTSLRELLERVRWGNGEAPRRYELARLLRGGALDGLPGGFDKGGETAHEFPRVNSKTSTAIGKGGEATHEFPQGNSAAGAVREFTRVNSVTGASAATWSGGGLVAADGSARARMLVLLKERWPEEGGARANAEAFAPPPVADNPHALLAMRSEEEIRHLGFTPSSHPLPLCPGFAEARKRCMTARELHKAAALASEKDDLSELGRVSLMGLKVTGKRTRTHRDGRLMAFYTFSDETGNFEAVFYPRDYARLAGRLRGRGPFIITGDAEAELGIALIAAKELGGI